MMRTMLYFGSFNPVHKGHIALAEYVLRKDLCDSVVLIVSPQNPLKEQRSLLPEMARFEMVEVACKESAEPERIHPSAVEFLLEKPSYTINTLRFLEENSGSRMSFSILMGADNLENLHRWKEYGEILRRYPIFVYPRTGYTTEEYAGRVTVLDDAPVFDCSATAIRNDLRNGRDVSQWLGRGVLEYIRRNGLFERTDAETEPLREVALGHFRANRWGEALNAFRRILAINPDDIESQEYIKMTEEILEFRYKDIYNP